MLQVTACSSTHLFTCNQLAATRHSVDCVTLPCYACSIVSMIGSESYVKAHTCNGGGGASSILGLVVGMLGCGSSVQVQVVEKKHMVLGMSQYLDSHQPELQQRSVQCCLQVHSTQKSASQTVICACRCPHFALHTASTSAVLVILALCVNVNYCHSNALWILSVPWQRPHHVQGSAAAAHPGIWNLFMWSCSHNL